MSRFKNGLSEIKIRGYFSDGDLKEDSSISALWKYHINKARHNIETAALLVEASTNPEAKRQLKTAADYTGYDWSISCSYYAMYHAAVSALASIGIKARTHESLIEGLEFYFVRSQKSVQSGHIKQIQSAKRLDEKYVNRMRAARSRRNTAQYKADAEIARKDAEKTFRSAVDFVNATETLLKQTET